LPEYDVRYKILPDCETAHQLLSRLQDGDLPLILRARLRLHLAACPACSEFSRQLTVLRQSMHNMDNAVDQDDNGTGNK
jgi:predicted anti-sigma-YlaC factor YlaD